MIAWLGIFKGMHAPCETMESSPAVDSRAHMAMWSKLQNSRGSRSTAWTGPDGWTHAIGCFRCPIRFSDGGCRISNIKAGAEDDKTTKCCKQSMLFFVGLMMFLEIDLFHDVSLIACLPSVEPVSCRDVRSVIQSEFENCRSRWRTQWETPWFARFAAFGAPVACRNSWKSNFLVDVPG